MTFLGEWGDRSQVSVRVRERMRPRGLPPNIYSNGPRLACGSVSDRNHRVSSRGERVGGGAGGDGVSGRFGKNRGSGLDEEGWD